MLPLTHLFQYNVLIIFVLLMAYKVQGYDGDHNCVGTIFRDEYYEGDVLYKDFKEAYNLVMHEPSANLFFAHGKDHLSRQIICCYMPSSECHNVTGIPGGGHTLYLDRKKDILYIGGHDGIYDYDFKGQVAHFVGARKTIIWCIFTDKELFYIEHPSHNLYKMVGEKTSIKIGTLQYDQYFVSKHSVHYYTNKAGWLYKIEKPGKYSDKPVLLNHKVKVQQIVEDIYGVVYFCGGNGIFIDMEPYRILTNIVDIEDLQGLTVINRFSHTIAQDKLIIVYSDRDGIHDFLPSIYSTYCLKKLFPNATRMGPEQASAESKKVLSLSLKVEYD